MEYRPNPQTGAIEAVPVKEEKGDLWRHIVTGAILGMASAKGTNSVLGGFAAGGAAGIAANRNMDQQKYARAQQDFQNQREAQRGQREKQADTRADTQIEMERQKNTAQLEMWNKEQILHERDANLRDAEFNQRSNENSMQMQRWAHEAGGIDAPIPGNNQVGNGAAMQKLYAQDPTKFQAPKGYDRFITQDHDTTGLTYDKDKGFIDEQGNPVNLEARTTWHVSFVPQKPQPLDIDGATLNRLFPKTMGGVADPKQTYHMPFEHLAGMATTEHEMSRRDADETYKRKHDDLRADMDELKSKANNFTRQADEAERQGDRGTAQQLRQQAADAYDEYDEVKQQANPHSQLRKSDSGRPKDGAPPAAGPQFTLKDVDTGSFFTRPGRGRGVVQIPGISGEDTTKTINDINALQTVKERQDYIDRLKVPDRTKSDLRRASLSVDQKKQEFSATPAYTEATSFLDKLSPEARAFKIDNSKNYNDDEKAVLRKHYNLQ